MAYFWGPASSLIYTHAKTLPVLSKQAPRVLATLNRHYFFSYSQTLVEPSLLQETNVLFKGFRSKWVIWSVCPTKEHKILLSWRDQYMMRTRFLVSSIILMEKLVLTVVVSFASTKDRLVVMCEPNQINTIALRIVSVDFPTKKLKAWWCLLSPLQVVKSDTIIFASSDKVLSIVRNIDWVHLFLL